MDIVGERRSKGATVMLVTHRMEEVEQLCDRILLLKDGQAALYGTIDEVKENFGSQVIALNYSGVLPANDKLFRVIKRLPHHAELEWQKGVSTDEVFRYLANSKDLHITTFDVRRPTLDDIFLALYKDQGADSV